jgi:hypothetical protein
LKLIISSTIYTISTACQRSRLNINQAMKLFILLCLCLVATMASAQNATIAATTTSGLAGVTKTTTGTTGAVVQSNENLHNMCG